MWKIWRTIFFIYHLQLFIYFLRLKYKRELKMDGFFAILFSYLGSLNSFAQIVLNLNNDWFNTIVCFSESACGPSWASRWKVNKVYFWPPIDLLFHDLIHSFHDLFLARFSMLFITVPCLWSKLTLEQLGITIYMTPCSILKFSFSVLSTVIALCWRAEFSKGLNSYQRVNMICLNFL